MTEIKGYKAPSLFELTEDLEGLLQYGYDPEMEEAFNDTLEGIMGGIEDKADNYCAVLSHFDANIQMIKDEEARLKARREVIENNVKRMKEALKRTLETMEANGMEKPEIKTALHTIKLAGNGGKQPMKVEEDKVPDNYKVIVYQTDTEKIRKELESGTELSFAHLESRGRHISIK